MEGSSAILPSPNGAISAPSMTFAESGPVEASSSNEGLPNAFALGAEYAPGASSVELVDGYMSAQFYQSPGRVVVKQSSKTWEADSRWLLLGMRPGHFVGVG